MNMSDFIAPATFAAPTPVPMGTPFYVLHYVRAVHNSCESEHDNDRYSVFSDSDGNGRIFKFGARTTDETVMKMLTPFIAHHKKVRAKLAPVLECPCFIKMRNRWNGYGTVVESLIRHCCPSCGENAVVVWEDKDSELPPSALGGSIIERRDNVRRTPLGPYIAKHELAVARERFENAQKELELASAQLMAVAEKYAKSK